jgi:hypothetical protein
MRAQAQALRRTLAVRRARPPKRPPRPALRPLPIAISLPAILLYYLAASHLHHPGRAGLLGVAVLCYVDELALWWRWRAWSAWSGEPIWWWSRGWTVVAWLAAASLWLASGSALVGLP